MFTITISGRPSPSRSPTARPPESCRRVKVSIDAMGFFPQDHSMNVKQGTVSVKTWPVESL
jgi:hypothetical protein